MFIMQVNSNKPRIARSPVLKLAQQFLNTAVIKWRSSQLAKTVS